MNMEADTSKEIRLPYDKSLPTVAVLMPDEMRKRILTPDAEDQLRQLANIVVPSTFVASEKEFSRAFDQAVACLTGWGTPPLSDELLAANPQLGLIAHTAGSIRRLVSPLAMSRGVRVSHAANVIADAVAEQVILSCLLCIRPLHRINEEMKAGADWAHLREEYAGRLLGNMTVGIVGSGYVGRAVIHLFRAFGCRVLVSDPYLDIERAQALGAELTDLPSILAHADIFSLHAPVLPETRGMIGPSELRALRDGVIFINAARSALVNQDALLSELTSGRFTAVLDVFDEEPLPLESPFRGLTNVVLSPHSAGHTKDTHERQGQAMVDEIGRHLTDAPLLHEVTASMIETMA